MENRIKNAYRDNFISIIKNIFIIIVLLLFSAACHLYIIYRKKIFAIYGTDSVLQFMYYIPFLQKAFISGQPFWSWSYGLGGDVLGQFSYYYTTSPFFYMMLLLRALGIGSWTLKNTLQWKLIFSIFKQFLSMLFMYILMKYEGKKTSFALSGAIVYGGCIFFIWLSLLFDFMADAYIWLPLTVLGLRIYHKTGKWLFLVISAAFTAANSFYFGFISYVFYTIYILVFFATRGHSFREKSASFFKGILKYAVLASAALGLSSVAFIPAVSALFNTDRFSKIVKIPAFYDISYFIQLPEKLFSLSDILGLPVLALIILFLPWRKLSSTARRKTVLVGILFLLYLIPYTGSFFNGFSYYTKRWFYIFIFSAAYALPDWLEENDRLKSFNIYSALLIAIFLIFCLYTEALRGINVIIVNKRITAMTNSVILVVEIASFLALALKRYVKNRSINTILDYTVVLCIMAVLIANNYIFMYTQKNYYITDAMLQGSCMENKEEEQIFSKTVPGKDEFYRTIFRNPSQENAALNYGFYGASAYNSMIERNLHRWIKIDYDILHPTVSASKYSDFDDRLFIEAAFGVKYIVNRNDTNIRPYGYTLKDKTKNYSIYENQNSTGIDLWYTSTTNRQTYDSMNYAEKDAMLLQTAMVDKNISGLGSYKAGNITTELKPDWTHVTAKNAEYSDGVITAGKNASIDIPVINNLKGAEGEILFSMYLRPENGQTFTVNINGKSSKKMYEDYPYIYPINNFTFRLDGSTDILRINISEGTYTIKNVNIWFNSYKEYESMINDRNKYNLENLYINGGNVGGTIKNNEKGILTLSIPYSGGWSAKVDGKKQEIIKVNGVFSGLVLKPGSHKIELHYVTPGLIPGACISGFTLLMIICFYISKSIKKKNKIIY